MLRVKIKMGKKIIRNFGNTAMPVTIVGANVNGKPNFMTVGFYSWVEYKPKSIFSVSIEKRQYTNQGVKENGTFSVNIPSEKMMQVADYIGMKSGRDIDKTSIFDVFYGDLETAPMINEAPVNHECKVVKTIDFDGIHDVFFGEVIKSYADEDLCEEGLNIKNIKPILLNLTKYYSVGSEIGDAYKVGLKYESK